MHYDFPRVLLVSSSAFNAYSGGGVLLSNLFRGWPRDRIATLHSEILPLETDVCETYFKLGADEVQLAIPFAESVRSWYRLRKMGGMDGSGKMGGVGRGTGASTIRYFYRLLALAGDGLPETVRLSRALIQWVESFRPGVLYTLLGSLAYIRLVTLLQERFGIPVVIHIMDDWPEHLYRRGVFGPFLRRRMHGEFNVLLRTAQARLGICDAMCKEYERRYGLPFVTFHNPVEESEWRSSGKSGPAGTPFRIVYYGTIVEVAQLRSVMDVGWAVHGLRGSGLDVEFRVHTQYYSLQQHRGVLETCPGIRIGSETGKDDFKSVITAADLLVLPVNFDRRSVRYLRLSFPAKLPAYMASGTPILAYGPLEMAQIRYLAEAGAAHVVSERSREALAAAIRRLMSDAAYRAQIGRRAHDLALERHGATRVRAAFRSTLAQAARQTVTVP
jgi:glycosyltransferase involved in cell wall biosynthesis